MKTSLLHLLRCPVSGQSLHAEDIRHVQLTPSSLEIDEGWLVSRDKKNRYPVRGGIPRFVPKSNYADNFGMQWNKFSRTQLDSHSGHPISAERFWAATGWTPADLKGRWILDVGCGSGRFAEVALNAGANVVALDYSSAVDAIAENLNHFKNLHIVQGDIYNLPFAPSSFDRLYCLGVLQHTPNVEHAFKALPNMLRPGGALVVDFYCKSWKSKLLPKYWLRPFTKRMSKATLFRIVELLVPVMLPISNTFAAVPLVGRYLRRIVPVANYTGMLPLSEQQIREWALLDTFDWLSPAYDFPQTTKTVHRWLQEVNLQQIDVLSAGHLVGRGYKP